MRKLTTWQVFYAVDMTIACAISYAIIGQLLAQYVDEPTKLLGGMWSVVATVFVFRESRTSALSAGISPQEAWLQPFFASHRYRSGDRGRSCVQVVRVLPVLSNSRRACEVMT